MPPPKRLNSPLAIARDTNALTIASGNVVADAAAADLIARCRRKVVLECLDGQRVVV